jgi:hypothetical protein
MPPLPAVNLPNIRQQLPVEHVAPDGHLELVERVLHDVVGVQLVDASDGDVDVGLRRVGEEQELGARHGVEALQPKVLGLEHLEPRLRLGAREDPGRRGGVGGGGDDPRCGGRILDGVQTSGDGVNAGRVGTRRLGLAVAVR